MEFSAFSHSYYVFAYFAIKKELPTNVYLERRVGNKHVN